MDTELKPIFVQSFPFISLKKVGDNHGFATTKSLANSTSFNYMEPGKLMLYQILQDVFDFVLQLIGVGGGGGGGGSQLVEQTIWSNCSGIL